jgi:hypothetical protein
VLPERLRRLGLIHDLQVRLVAKIVDFCPIDGDTTADLDERETLTAVNTSTSRGHASALRNRVKEYNLLRLVEVGGIAVVVDTTAKVTGANAVTRATRDEAEEEVTVVDGGRTKLKD